MSGAPLPELRQPINITPAPSPAPSMALPTLRQAPQAPGYNPNNPVVPAGQGMFAPGSGLAQSMQQAYLARFGPNYGGGMSAGVKGRSALQIGAEEGNTVKSIFQNFQEALNNQTSTKKAKDKEQQLKAETLRKEKLAEEKPFEIGGQLVQKQPDGSYKAVFGTQKTPEPPTSYQEWGLAGRPGTYQEWVRKTGLRPLPAAQATTLSEGFQIPLVTKSVDDIIKNKGNLFGPIEGLKALNPWDVQHKTIDDDLRRASQIIGRFMEGGVLRKEDEEKYRKMLPVITDNIQVATDKLVGIKKLLADKSAQYLSDYEAAGFDVSGFMGKLPGTENMNTGQSPIDQMKKDGLSDSEIEQILGHPLNSVGGDTNQASRKLGFRTDRNNNPTAMIYAPSFNKALDEAGIAYSKGDVFPDNSKLHTIKFDTPADGINGAIAVIDNLGFYTSYGQQRWTHTAMPQSQWNRLTPEQKIGVVKNMYQKEGGSGKLFSNIA